MKGHHYLIGLALVVIATLVGVPVSAQSYSLIATIQLPGNGGHGDWVTYDPGANKVYVALHESGVAVIDASSNKVVGDIDPIKGPNGIAWDSNYVYAAAGDSNELVTISKSNWTIVSRVKTKGTTPDGIWVDTQRGKVIVASDDNNWVEVYTAGMSPKLSTTIKLLPAKAETGPDVGVLVPQKGYLYMPDDAMVEIVNLETNLIGMNVDTHVKLAKNGGTKNMVYDAKTNHLWVGTTGKEVLILDADTLQVVGRSPSHGGMDQLSFDPALRLVYTFESSSKGFDVFNADTLKPVAFVTTGSGNTHTGDVNPTTHYVYVYEGDANVVGVYSPGM